MTRNEDDEKAELELIGLIEQRAILAELVKVAAPGKGAEGRRLLREMDEKIERVEASIARLQESVTAQDKAPDVRRKQAIDLLTKLDRIEKAAAHNLPALEKLALVREESLNFLRLDAEERCIPNDDY